MEKRFSVHIAGSGVQEGKIALDDLRRILGPLQAAVRAMLPPGETGEKTNLLVSNIGVGSVTAEIEIEAVERPGLPGFERDPIGKLIAAASDPAIRLPQRARKALDKVATNLPDGVDSVELHCASADKSTRITRVDRAPRPSVREEYRAVEGRLVEIDFHAGAARLDVQSRTNGGRATVKFEFEDRFADELQRFARQIVRVHGIAQLDADDVITTLQVVQVEHIRDDLRGLWAPKRFKWPTEDEVIHDPDIEEFLHETREARQDST